MNRGGWWLAFGCVGALALARCGGGGSSPPVDAGPDVDPTGTEGHACFANGTCNAGLTCASNVCVKLDGSAPDAGSDADACTDVHFTPTKTKPYVELLLDRSGSMLTNDISPDRFDAVQSALTGSTGTVTTNQSSVYFGAALFAGDESPCPPNASLDDMAVSRALDNAAMIATLLTSNTPSTGSTPTAPWITAVTSDFATSPPPSGSAPVILLATDGVPNDCSGGTNSGAAVTATQAAYTAGIRTFVVGIAGLNTQFLQDIANAGDGKATAQTPGCQGCAPYYAASDAASLASGFDAIVGGLVSCDLAINGKVDTTQASQGVLQLNGNTLTYGTDWSVDPDGTTLQLRGSACDTYKNATTPTVDVAFPCTAVLP
jgi:hypothetical protein